MFALLHVVEQGRDGAIQAMFTGVVFGAIYARTRSLWMLMVAHAAFDLVAVAIIYGGFEENVSRMLFR